MTLSRFTILPKSPTSILDRCEGQTFRGRTIQETQRLFTVLNTLQKQNEQCDLSTLKALHAALEDLVQLKDYKDKNGKDTYYLEQQPKCWNNARQLLQKVSPYDL